MLYHAIGTNYCIVTNNHVLPDHNIRAYAYIIAKLGSRVNYCAWVNSIPLRVCRVVVKVMLFNKRLSQSHIAHRDNTERVVVN